MSPELTRFVMSYSYEVALLSDNKLYVLARFVSCSETVHDVSASHLEVLVTWWNWNIVKSFKIRSKVGQNVFTLIWISDPIKLVLSIVLDAMCTDILISLLIVNTVTSVEFFCHCMMMLFFWINIVTFLGCCYLGLGSCQEADPAAKLWRYRRWWWHCQMGWHQH